MIIDKIGKGVVRLKNIISKSKADNYIDELKENFSKIFQHNKIKPRQNLKMPSGIYSPIIDLTVGPLAINDSRAREYSHLVNVHKEFFGIIKKRSVNKNEFNYYRNPNPRCFIGIEVEDTTQNKAKYIEGSICNLYILAKVGILVTLQSKTTIRRIYKYLQYSKDRRKTPEYLFKNVALMTKKDLDSALQEYLLKKKHEKIKSYG